MKKKLTKESEDERSGSADTNQKRLSEYGEGEDWPEPEDHIMRDGGRSHASPEDCAAEGTVAFDEDIVWQGEKVARLGTCNVCDRKFERVYYFSHDQCYDPEFRSVVCQPSP